MLSLRTGMNRATERRGHVNAYAIFAVNEHLEYLIDEAARNRIANAGKPSLRKRIASALAGFQVNAAKATGDWGSTLSKSENSPYRG
jgi:hypothetical protein